MGDASREVTANKQSPVYFTNQQIPNAIIEEQKEQKEQKHRLFLFIKRLWGLGIPVKTSLNATFNNIMYTVG